MNLIFIYGPPASGKLTVAEQLSKITNYKIFHNHLTNDLVNSVFDYGTDIFIKFVHKYRLDLIETAAKQKINGLIFTFVYYKDEDDKFIREIVRKVKKHNGMVYFVQLICSRGELFRRVKDESRKGFSKIKKTKILNELMNSHDLFSGVPYKQNIKIDNTNLSPNKVAKIIKEKYKL